MTDIYIQAEQKTGILPQEKAFETEKSLLRGVIEAQYNLLPHDYKSCLPENFCDLDLNEMVIAIAALLPGTITYNLTERYEQNAILQICNAARCLADSVDPECNASLRDAYEKFYWDLVLCGREFDEVSAPPEWFLQTLLSENSWQPEEWETSLYDYLGN
ncbi:hypothetical protein H6764_02840 [Candidatus Nomurabacteria bacterium]|nr:hypothetical protein [Candidatus Nomurabacteria bacterium]